MVNYIVPNGPWTSNIQFCYAAPNSCQLVDYLEQKASKAISKQIRDKLHLFIPLYLCHCVGGWEGVPLGLKYLHNTRQRWKLQHAEV